MLVVAVGNEYHNQIDGSILTNIIELHTEFNKLGHFIFFCKIHFEGRETYCDSELYIASSRVFYCIILFLTPGKISNR